MAGSMNPAHAETLEDAMIKAIKYHPQIEQAKARIDAADENEAAEFSGFFPELNVSSYAGRIYGDNATSRGLTVSRGSAYSNSWEASVSARQPIFDGFETSARVKAAEDEKMSAEMTLVDAQEQISYRTAQTYLAVMQARTALAMLKQQQKKVDDYLGRIKGAMEDGAADETEYQQARDVSVILDGFAADFENELATAESQYFELTGEMPPEDMERPVMNLSELPQTLGAAITDALATHPTIKSAEFAAQSAEHDIKAEQGLLYPDINGELSYLESDKEEVLGGEVIDGRALVRMSWTFETGGGQLARIRQKKHEHSEALAQEKQIKLQIERDLRIAYAAFENAKRRLANQKEREDLNRKLFDTYTAQFEGGKVRLLQLMQADNQLFNTKLETVTTKYRLMNAGFAILAGMGQLHDSVVQRTALLTETDIEPAAGPASQPTAQEQGQIEVEAEAQEQPADDQTE